MTGGLVASNKASSLSFHATYMQATFGKRGKEGWRGAHFPRGGRCVHRFIFNSIPRRTMSMHRRHQRTLDAKRITTHLPMASVQQMMLPGVDYGTLFQSWPNQREILDILHKQSHSTIHKQRLGTTQKYRLGTIQKLWLGTLTSFTMQRITASDRPQTHSPHNHAWDIQTAIVQHWA